MIAFISQKGRLFFSTAAFITIITAAWASWFPDLTDAGPLPLALDKAIETALSQRSEVAASANDVLAAAGRVTKSAALPNPELGLETSSLGDEDSIIVSQTYQFERKRSTRVKAAEAEIPIVENDRMRTRLDIIDEVSQAFVALLGAQEKQALVQEAYGIAERFAVTVAERVAAGAISAVEETRAQVALAGASIDLTAAGRELAMARLALAAAMGSREAGFDTLEGRIPDNPLIPDKSALLAAAVSNPDLTRWQLEREKRSAVVESELAAAIPDITFSGKVTHDRDNDETAVIFGMSVPLPLFDKNKGGVLEARAELDKARYEAQSEALRVGSEIEKRHGRLTTLAAEIGTVRDRMLSFAQQAHDAVLEGYRLGKFRYLDVLDASRELTSAKLRHLDLLISFELEKTAMNRLVANAQERLKGESK